MPCMVKKWISDSTRRWEIIPNASSSSTTAKKLINWPDSELIWLGSEENARQHRHDGKQEGGGEEFGHAEDAHLGADGFQRRKERSADAQLEHEHRSREQQREGGFRLGHAPGE